MSLGSQAQREPGKIYFCLELSRRLRCFPAIPGAFELLWIEQSHIFPRRKKKTIFQADFVLKKELLKRTSWRGNLGRPVLAYFLSWWGRVSGSREVWPWPEHSSKANGSRAQISRAGPSLLALRWHLHPGFPKYQGRSEHGVGPYGHGPDSVPWFGGD